ncbi:MAG: hypothetical protein A2133_03000 [Actinobacteria bacterium RBG_16_64_13]|nr:MAG: hypothetical protein A2133_03000 [Actinobacteria bacterium RBG_16_64_13]
MVAGRSESSYIVYNELAKHGLRPDRVFLENDGAAGSYAFLRRRIKRLGLVTVVGQLLFRLGIVPVLMISSRRRINFLKQSLSLDATPIDEKRITPVRSVNSAQVIDHLGELRPRVVVINGTRILTTTLVAAGMRVPVIHGTVVARTAWFIRNRYDESAYARRCEDAELWFRTYGTSVVRSLSEPLLFVTEDVRNTMRKLRSSNKGRLKIMFLGKGEVRKKQLSVRLALAAAICLKMAFYELCWAVGARQYLIDRRNQRLDTAQAAAAAHTLEEVLRCPVPGLDPAAR